MARTSTPPQAPESMTPAQLGRRRRVVGAVLQLVAAGRLDDLGMKEVAERSGVALGTIYRYFSSKDHLAAAALAEWAETLDGRSGRAQDARGVARGPAADRLVAILRRAVRAYERQPDFARLLVLAATSTDPFARDCYQRMGASVYTTLGAALDDLDPGQRRRVLDVVGAVWYQAMIDWVNGRKSIDDVYESVESAARLVLAAYER
jgi:TetR/AcrR family transcriptional regulator, cholesterol catabolism regulator